MIYKQLESVIEKTGEMKSYKATIQAENISFITSILSTNFYSMPEESFIREIVSNAWDAHVAAGNTNEPVIILFNGSNKTITIRDYGTGLTEQEFQNLYCNIGASSKRNSNDYIGMWGLGHLTPMAVSNMATIVNYHNGKKYTYIMTKDNNDIITNLVNTTDTNDRNGLEVSVNFNDTNIGKYIKALDYIKFFPNVFAKYISESNENYHDKYKYINFCIKDFNEYKIKEYIYYKVLNTSVSNKILLGNVLYPLNLKIVNNKYINEINKLSTTGFVFKFNIGELNVTPNREAIQYTNETISNINNRIGEALKELNTNIKPVVEKYKHCTNLWELKNKLYKTCFINIFNLDISAESNNSVSFNLKYYYNNVLVTDFIKNYLLNKVYYTYFKDLFSISAIYIKNHSSRTGNNILSLKSNTVFLKLKNTSKLTNYLKNYIKERFCDKQIYIFKDSDLNTLQTFYHKLYTIYDSITYNKIPQSVKDSMCINIFNDLNSIPKIELDYNDKKIQKYIQDKKDEIKQNKFINNILIFYKVYYNDYREKKEVQDLDNFFVNKHKIILGEYGNGSSNLVLQLAKNDDIEYYLINNTMYKKLLNSQYKNHIITELDYLNSKNNLIGSLVSYKDLPDSVFNRVKYIFDIGSIDTSEIRRCFGILKNLDNLDLKGYSTNAESEKIKNKILELYNLYLKADKYIKDNISENLSCYNYTLYNDIISFVLLYIFKKNINNECFIKLQNNKIIKYFVDYGKNFKAGESMYSDPK